MCISQARIRHVLVSITYFHALVHKLFLQANIEENPWQCYYACIHLYVSYMPRHPIDMQCLHVHLSMGAGERIEKAEGVDRCASMSFNIIRGKIVLLCYFVC